MQGDGTGDGPGDRCCRGVQEFGEQTALEVKPASGDVILIPLVRAICVEIDTASKRIVVDPPEGLLN